MTTAKGDFTPPTMVEDKSIPERSGSVHSVSAGGAATVQEESFLTRHGLNLASFKKRHYGHGIVELDRPMKPRHLNMIAIGGAIGAGFFVGSGKAFSSGGPASVLICFCITGVLIFNVVFALGELAVLFPITGGFYTLSTRFIDPSWGFAMGYNYLFSWAFTLPLELTVCGIVVGYWDTSTSVGVWITVMWILIILINVFGSLGYAEEEFWAAILKIITVSIFMVICLVMILGGGPAGGKYNEYSGTKLWSDPGAFRNGFRGFCSVFVTAAVSFNGSELVGLAAAESKNPVKALPSAIKQVFWRITLFYVVGLTLVGFLIRSDDPNLISDSAYTDVNASPFVLVGLYSGLKGLDNYLNAVILISVLSVGVSAVYGGSRTLTALAQQGYAPKIFTYIDRSGRPLASVVAMICCGLLAYVNLSASGPVVFDWLLALTGLATIFTWGSICFAHIRFRKAWAYHGHSLDEIPFKAFGGVYGSWLGLFLAFIVLLAQLFTAIAPAGKEGLNDAEGFFKACLTLPIILVFWVCGFCWKKEGWLRTSEMDVDTGRRELDWDEIRAHREHVASLPMWRRLVHKLF
ncbi:amino-acid permease inda1 [Ilyonectria destructans]|nr:amino-acid permease inda1 [Ilyonectria destructans]